MNNTTYDLRVNSHGKAQPMAHGFFKHTAELVSPGTPYDYEKECKLIGVYYVEKQFLNPENNSYLAKVVREFLKNAEKKTSEAQRRAVAKYDQKNTKQILLKLNKTTDADILEMLSSQKNVQGYIKQLIRDNINQ